MDRSVSSLCLSSLVVLMHAKLLDLLAAAAATSNLSVGPVVTCQVTTIIYTMSKAIVSSLCMASPRAPHAARAECAECPACHCHCPLYLITGAGTAW